MGMSNTRAGSKTSRIGSKISKARWFGSSDQGSTAANPPSNPPADAVIQMDDLVVQAANSETTLVPNTHQAQEAQQGAGQDGAGQDGAGQGGAGQQGARQQGGAGRDDPDGLPTASWFPLFLLSALSATTFILLLYYKDSHPEAEWTREGSAEKLTPGQVIFASVSKPFIWTRFLGFLCLQVLNLAVVRWVTWAAPSASTKAKLMRTLLQELFFAVAVALLATFMWGWLLWMI